MASSLYEIVELGNGEIGLRRAGEDGEPLVRIRFSSEAEFFLRDARLDVAKIMIEAGLEAVAEMAEDAEDIDSSLESEQRTLH